MHLLRSLFAGYFTACAVGTIAVMNGYGPLSVVLGVWLSGSVLSVAIAAIVSPFEEDEHRVPVPVGEHFDQERQQGPLHRHLTAKELALWDKDLAAEKFEADLSADLAEATDTGTGTSADRKAG